MVVTNKRENGMAGKFGRRFAGLAGVLATLAFLVPASPASAQVPPGGSASPLVGSGILANCPAGSPGAVAGGTATVNGVTVYGPAGGQCTPLADTTSGEYTAAGVGTTPLRFNAACANSGGAVTTNGGVDVPAGTLVNGVPVATNTLVTAPNTPVVFPGGRTAIVNQVVTTGTTVTRNAIVYTGGPTVGQVVCGASVYPLDVSVGAPSADLSAPPLLAADDEASGLSTMTLVAGGAVALAFAAQVVFAVRRRRATV